MSIKPKTEPSDWTYLNIKEYEAAKDTAVEAGEYIESLGKTDLATYSKDEFETLLLVICNAFVRRAPPF